MKQFDAVVSFDRIAGGGRSIGTTDDGQKVFAWGVLPGETARVRIHKRKSSLLEGVAVEILKPSKQRVEPRDQESYLSTSPWQIMSPELEAISKRQLIDEAFALHHVTLPGKTTLYSDDKLYGYRNKVEFSWFGHEVDGKERLDLAFFRRGSKGKIPVDGTSLAHPQINRLARAIRDHLQSKAIPARSLKTLMIRSTQAGACVWQLYVKDRITPIDETAAAALPAAGGEVIYSDPRSPASRITERLASFGETTLTDTVFNVPFHYACEGFFQVNLPVYEQALHDMKQWLELEDGRWQMEDSNHVVDFYSGVGTIGLTIGGDRATLVEVDPVAVGEMQRNIERLDSSARAVLAASEQALEYITPEATIIVDPPRAGLHADVTARLLETLPPRIIYLSCNPVTQARDVGLLRAGYAIVHHAGYNFFPRTPHIEHLVVLDHQPSR